MALIRDAFHWLRLSLKLVVTTQYLSNGFLIVAVLAEGKQDAQNLGESQYRNSEVM